MASQTQFLFQVKSGTSVSSVAQVKTKHDRAELRMRALQFTADRGVV
jgi:hypothetical protein